LVKRSAAELAKNLAADPFCSSECARIYHGCPLPTVGPQGGSTSKEFRHGTEYGYDQGCREDCCRKASYEARKARREKAAA
jgi:hypothetical protein